MGERNHDRQVTDARTAYLGALKRFTTALGNWVTLGVPLDPGTEQEPQDWTRHDVRMLLALHQSLGELISKRRTLDALRREFRRPPH